MQALGEKLNEEFGKAKKEKSKKDKKKPKENDDGTLADLPPAPVPVRKLKHAPLPEAYAKPMGEQMLSDDFFAKEPTTRKVAQKLLGALHTKMDQMSKKPDKLADFLSAEGIPAEGTNPIAAEQLASSLTDRIGSDFLSNIFKKNEQKADSSPFNEPAEKKKKRKKPKTDEADQDEDMSGIQASIFDVMDDEGKDQTEKPKKKKKVKRKKDKAADIFPDSPIAEMVSEEDKTEEPAGNSSAQ